MNRAFEINVDKKTMKIKPSTKEGKFAEAHIELMKTYKDDFVGEDGALRQVLNPAQVEKYIDDALQWAEGSLEMLQYKLEEEE